MGNIEKPNSIIMDRDAHCTTRRAAEKRNIEKVHRVRENTITSPRTPAELMIRAIIAVFNLNCRGA